MIQKTLPIQEATTLLTYLLKQSLKWGAWGAFGGAAVGFFLYQKVSPSFESCVVLRLVPVASTGMVQDQNYVESVAAQPPEMILLTPELLLPPIQTLDRGTAAISASASAEKAESIVSSFLSGEQFKVHRLNTVEGATLYRVSYRDGLPSRARDFIQAYADYAELALNGTDRYRESSDAVDRLTFLKTDSEVRIRSLKAQLIELPLDAEARWVDGGLVSPAALEWNSLQQQADRLHDRKAMLQERLMQLKAEQQAGPDPQTGPEPKAGPEPQGETFGVVNRKGANDDPFTSADLVSTSAMDSGSERESTIFSTSKSESQLDRAGQDRSAQSVDIKFEYLTQQIQLIFEQHLEISQQMRALARKLDLEEQIAFEVYSLRRELTQELTIRDRILSEMAIPTNVKTDLGYSIDLIETPSSPIQVEPSLSRYLTFGGLMGSILLMMLSGFITAVGFEEPE